MHLKDRTRMSMTRDASKMMTVDDIVYPTGHLDDILFPLVVSVAARSVAT